MSKTYSVEIRGEIHEAYEIEADSEQDAEDKAKEKLEKDYNVVFDSIEFDGITFECE